MNFTKAAGRRGPALDDLSPATSDACSLADCRFCGLEEGRRDLFWDLHGESPSLDLPGIPGSMMVLLCAFPIGHWGGHLLITPRRHYPSLAQFPRREDLRATVQATSQTVRRMFPGHWLLAFEHGPGAIDHRPVKCGGCHVDHAHGHVLVLDPTVDFEEVRQLTEATLRELGWDLRRQTSISTDPFLDIGQFTGEHPYLHLGMLAPRPVAFTYKQCSLSQSIPSQLLRRIVGEAAGRPQPSSWNWKIALEHGLHSRLRQYGDAALGFKRMVSQFLSIGVVPA